MAQRRHRMAVTGIYARLRHPQYLGFILVMTGFASVANNSGIVQVSSVGGDGCVLDQTRGARNSDPVW